MVPKYVTFLYQYMWIRGLKRIYGLCQKEVPQWFYNVCDKIQKIIIDLLWKAGSQYLEMIEAEIKRVDKLDLSNIEKYEMVYGFAKTNMPDWPEWKIDTIIQNLFAKLKEQGWV